MVVLHGHPRTGSTRKVRWALEELGVAYELRIVDLAAGEHRRGDYLALNPNGKVPTLVDDGFVLWESDAMLWYLATQHRALVPAPIALGHQWMSWNAHHLDEHTCKPRAYRLTASRTGGAYDPKQHAAMTIGAAPLLAILDAHLASTRYVVGSALSIADIALAMNVTFAFEEGVALEPFARVRAWHDSLASRPAFRMAAS